MSPARFTCALLTALCGVALCGCLPSGQSRLDEEKEPHFLTGRSRVNAMDYHGAIESFGQALEANPHSSAAHFELGWLFEEKDSDPAAAIYHYEQYLKLRPKAENAEMIRHRIFGLKQMLAQAVLPATSTSALQRECDQLTEENRHLREELEKYRAVQASRGTAPTNQPVLQLRPQRSPPAAVQQTLAGMKRKSFGTLRTHKVQAGESPAVIARRYGVRLEALLSVNPGLNPKRLQIGQTVNLPSS